MSGVGTEMAGLPLDKTSSSASSPALFSLARDRALFQSAKQQEIEQWEDLRWVVFSEEELK